MLVRVGPSPVGHRERESRRRPPLKEQSMTRQKTFKRRVRARMTKTGESYTAARRMLIAHGERPEPAPVAFEPPMSVEKVTEATGRSWEQWFALLDEWGAIGRSHTEMA